MSESWCVSQLSGNSSQFKRREERDIVPAGRVEKIVDNALVALTLMIAEGKPEEKDTMSKVVVNLIDLKN